MKQPDLGKKIAELRKAKGLTQDELVEKCNLSVRTLQRIESGEVTPRSYTIKIIFAALDFNIYDSSKAITNRFQRTGSIIFNWLEQLYKYVFDLFNLKTNTMKKLMILSIPFLTICVALALSFSSNAKAQTKVKIREKFERTSSQPKLIQWFNSAQFDSISLLYLDNACFMPENSPIIHGRESIKEYFRGLYNIGLRFTDSKSTSKIISDSIAIDRGTWTLKPINNPISVSGSYLTQYHYKNGQWWIENDMSNTNFKIDIEGHQ